MQIKHNTYFARTIRGLEDIVWQDICSSVDADLIDISHRVILFTSDAAPSELLSIRSVDDIFILVGRLTGIPHTRDALKVIASQLSSMNTTYALETCRQVRNISGSILYSVTASFIGARNYTRWEIAEAIRPVIESRNRWSYLDAQTEDQENSDIHIRVHLEHDSGIVGIRLAKRPLYKRYYKTEHAPGSLTAQAAYIMLRLAGPRAKGVVLDPTCGVGTIPIEASLSGSKCVLGCDASYETISKAKLNANTASVKALLFQADGARLPIEDSSVDAIVCNLPWQTQTVWRGGGLEFSLPEFRRVSRPHARWALMTDAPDSVVDALSASSLTLARTYQVSLFGKHPSILAVNVGKKSPAE